MDRYNGLKLVSRDTDLNVLVKVIGKLSSGEKCHVNYRDSKLTHILQNSLGMKLILILAEMNPCNILINQVATQRRQLFVP